MDKQAIIDRLDKKAYYSSELPSIKWNGNDTGQAICPFHNDTDPSLSVNYRTGQFNCFGCNKKGSIFDYYMARHGVDYKTAFNALAQEAGVSEKVTSKIVETYDYTNEAGKLIFQTTRHEPKDFRQRQPDGKGGWIWNLQGVQLSPYNLPEVIKSDTVFIVEGEKDVENLRKIGLVASCNPMGAGKWRPEYNEHFRGKNIIILPDNDKAGQEHASQVAKNLHGIASSIRIVELPGLPVKGDVSDWIQAGGIKASLEELTKNTLEYKLSETSHVGGGQLDSSIPAPFAYLQKGSDLRQLEIVIEWVIMNLLPKQSITILYGPGGIGKTWLSLILSQAIAAVDNFMGLAAVQMPVVYIDFENPYPVLIDRVKRIGIDDVLFWHNSNEVLKPPRLDSDKWELYKTLPHGSLLIFDTLRASQSKDENDSQHMAFVMQRLKELRDLGFTILLLHHTPKGNDRTYKGSTAIIDLADHALSLHKVRKSNPEGGEIDEDDDHDCLYRLGTKNKTRYEPFHIFLSFDPEKGFIKSVDPDEADLQAIHEILTDKGPLNQLQLFEIVKTELDMKSKGKLVHLLRKRDGKLWHGQKEGRAFMYSAIATVQLSDPYTSDSGQFNKLSKTDWTDTTGDTLQTLDNSQLSNCPDVSQTVWTDDVIEVLEVIG